MTAGALEDDDKRYLDYEDIERLLDDPKSAPLSDIQTYCQALNLDVLDFIKKTLA
jgi:hypothetical protein